MRPVSYAVVGIRYLPKSFKVVFVVRIEDCSSVIDRRIIKLCVVLTQLCVSEVNVSNKVIFRSVWVVVINLPKAIFKRFKLVK
jgi:hypothetical protein